jgi:hypothetical protein
MGRTIETRADVTRFNTSHAVEIPNLLLSDSLTNFNNDGYGKCMLIFGVKLPIRYPFHEICVSLRLNLR